MRKPLHRLPPRVILLAVTVAALLCVYSWDKRSRVLPNQRTVARLAPDFKRSTATAAVVQPELAATRRLLPSITEHVSDWSAFTPETITIAPYPDLAIPFHVVRISKENGVTTWVGRNSLQGASLVGIGKPDRWFGVLTLMNATFDVHIHGDDVEVTEKSRAPLECGPMRDVQPPHMTERQASLVTNGERSAATVPTVGDPSIHTSGTTIYTVEASFYYAQDAEADAVDYISYEPPLYQGIPKHRPLAEVPSYLDSKYRAYIETNNLILEQSKVPNLRWHFQGIFRAPDYTPQVWDHKGDNGAARYDMLYDSSVFYNEVDGPTGRFVQAKAADLFSDQRIAVTGNNRNFGGLSGNQDAHFCIVSDTDASNLLVAHEMGHGFGLHHDRETDAGLWGGTGYNWGYKFHYDLTRFGGIGTEATPGDVMCYGMQFPYFSNPNVFIRGTDIQNGSQTQNDNALYALGVAADQPTAAYAARTLWEGAAAMAAWRNDPSQVFPAVSVQPVTSRAVSVGGQLTLSAAATGTALSYQWRKNGADIAGATSSTFTQANVSLADAGAYDVVVTNVLGSVITRAATVSVSTQPLTSRLVNISTRSQVGTAASVQIAGFVISGSAPKTVLIRAGSAALAAAGLQGVLSDPTLELHDAQTTIATNDDWSANVTAADAIRAAALQVGASPWATGSKDAAILVTLNPGLYSAIVAGKNGSTGSAIVEVYEVSDTGGNVVNISTRSPVGTGDNVQIAGFVISGTAAKTVLIRAGGAALAAAGLQDTLANPTIELHDTQSTIATNDDWSADATVADAIRSAALQVGASPWTTGSKDAAILVTLNPGLYSAVVAGKGGTSGLAIVEVYDVTP